jgi:hypothetical protein
MTTALLKASFRVLGENKRLLVFPAVSLGAEAVVLAAFAVPWVVAQRHDTSGGTHLGPLEWIPLALCYVLLNVVAAFFNTALFFAVRQAFDGAEVSRAEALRAAFRRFPTIVLWVVLSSTIGLIIRTVERRVPIVVTLLDVAWSCVSFLALPVLAFEDAGLLAGTRRASRLFRDVWKEQFSAALRLGWLQLLLMIPVIVIMFFGLASGEASTMLAAAALCVLWFGLCVLLMSFVTGVFRVAMYVYATAGTTPAQFEGIDLSRAFSRQ